MVSVNKRIERATKRTEALVALALKQRDQEVLDMLEDDTVNMLIRLRGEDMSREDVAELIHGMTYDRTFDLAYEDREYRTRVRFQLLLGLCGGDKDLLLEKYRVVLNRIIPIKSKYFEWNPTLFVAHDDVTTVKYGWRRIKAQ